MTENLENNDFRESFKSPAFGQSNDTHFSSADHQSSPNHPSASTMKRQQTNKNKAMHEFNMQDY